MLIYRIAAGLALLASAFATVVQCLVLLGVDTPLIAVGSRILVWLFVGSCVAALFSNVQTSDVQILYRSRPLGSILTALSFLCLAYLAVYAVFLAIDNFSVFGHVSTENSNWIPRIARLWSSAACMWVFGNLAAYWRIKGKRNTS